MTVLLPIGGQDELVREVARLSGQNVYACYQCGKCTAGCPFSFRPQLVLRYLQLGHVDAALAVDAVWECAGCLTCTAGCPKGLDPALVMKTLRSLDEGRHRRGRERRLRALVFAYNHRLARLGSALAPASTWLLRSPPARWLSHSLLGIHRARPLPPFARPSFPAWFRRHRPTGDGHRGRVLLFHDTFMDYNFPDTGIAATELLERAGFQVELADGVCCGRPMISKGFTRLAQAQARANVARLHEAAAEGVAIVGCEPSCLLALRHDYPRLLDGTDLEEEARAVARQALLLDELLASLAAQGELELAFQEGAGDRRPVLFHAHCHQKALADPEASVDLLRLAGYRVELINAACCGMAGAFGYEREHYELSRAAGEKGLLPALRARPDADVVVTGVSCRQQIEHLASRRPRHLAQALRDALVGL